MRIKEGRGYSTVVEHTPTNQEVVGSYPARVLGIFFFFYLSLLSFAYGVFL